jgi:tripartite-type tricarboxylate transporter receptor subunit TctC
VKNVRELVALGKSRPGELNFASQGPGTLSHLEQEMLKQMGGFTALHVPYKGSAPGLSDLISGQVVLFFDSIPSALPQVKANKIRALGVASSQRSPALPDVPAIGESLKGFEADSWFGVLMPAGTPRDVVNRFNAEAQKALALQELKERLLSVGGFVHAGGPNELAARIKADVAKWGKVVRTAGIKAE